MKEVAFEFEVEGSALQPYRLLFVRRSGKKLSAYCTCPAGKNGKHCKHRLAIFGGITKGIVSGDLDQVAIIRSWLPGTDINSAIEKIQELESEALKIKKSLSAAKKELAKAMVG